jgi:hypothetical protein
MPQENKFNARFRLLEVAMQQSATDHATGQINLLGYVLHDQFSVATFVFRTVSATYSSSGFFLCS